MCTCTTHSGVKKAHDWVVDQLDLFRTTHRVKTQQVVKILGHHCGDIELTGYLANAVGQVKLLMTRSVNIVRTIITTLLTLSRLCRLLLVRMDVYIVTLSDFYSYRLIGKLTVFFQFQEFSQGNQTWEIRTCTFAARLS